MKSMDPMNPESSMNIDASGKEEMKQPKKLGNKKRKMSKR